MYLAIYQYSYNKCSNDILKLTNIVSTENVSTEIDQ